MCWLEVLYLLSLFVLFDSDAWVVWHDINMSDCKLVLGLLWVIVIRLIVIAYCKEFFLQVWHGCYFVAFTSVYT